VDRRQCLKMLMGWTAVGFAGSLGLDFAGALASEGTFPVSKTDEAWRKSLTPDQYRVLREEWTEAPYQNKYYNYKEKGTYHCAGCDQLLFSSKTKYDSQTGWPSFWQPVFSDAIGTKIDRKASAPRTEVHCARCGGHLGHVFDDGPEPTFLRYCINSAALIFKPAAG